MDPTVPRPAAWLLDFIRETEVGTDDRQGYDVIYGFNQDKLPKPITSMTVDEVLAAQAGWSKRFGSSATGGYQFMKATLGDLKRELGLSGRQVLDPNLQDRLGYHLLKRRGYEAFVAGEITRTEFGKRLAQEWASFPVLAATKGAHRSLARGQSYYSGDKLNKALVEPETVEAELDNALAMHNAPAPIVVETPAPTPKPEQETIVAPAPKPSPVEQSAKAAGAGKGIAKGTGFAGAVMTVLLALDLLPAALNTAEVGAALGVIVTGLTAFVWGIVDTYRAPKNAE